MFNDALEKEMKKGIDKQAALLACKSHVMLSCSSYYRAAVVDTKRQKEQKSFCHDIEMTLLSTTRSCFYRHKLMLVVAVTVAALWKIFHSYLHVNNEGLHDYSTRSIKIGHIGACFVHK